MTLTHFSLFSGIGGLDLAAEWVGFRTVGQVEYANYPFRVLRQRFGRMPRWRDIRDVTGEAIIERCGVPTVISGGFPCQPHRRERVFVVAHADLPRPQGRVCGSVPKRPGKRVARSRGALSDPSRELLDWSGTTFRQTLQCPKLTTRPGSAQSIQEAIISDLN